MTEKIEVYRIPNCDGFTATNVLTRDECDQLITAAVTAGFKRSGEGGGPTFSGQRKRACFTDEDLSEALFTRLRPFLSPLEHKKKLRKFNFVGQEGNVPSGTYVPIGVNDFFRVSKYDQLGNFRMHKDSGYARDDQYVGFWTILVYLNDDYKGGETTIYDDNRELLHTVKPEVGKVFAFYHFQNHAGLPVTSGNKLIARVEIMFALNHDNETTHKERWMSDLARKANLDF